MYYKKLIVLLIIFCLNLVYLKADNYYPINKLISDYKLEVTYNQINGSMLLKKNNKSVFILLESPFIIINNVKYFTYQFIISKDGQYYISRNYIKLLADFFTDSMAYKNNNFLEQNQNNQTNKDYFLNLKKDETLINENKLLDSLDISEDLFDSSVDSLKIKNQYIYEKEPKNLKINAIIIDPGHGGTDPGAIGYSGIKEKDIVLKAALLLYEKLKQNYKDKKIIITRNNDFFIPLEKRSQIANYVFNKYGPSLFISIHVNASRSSKSYGFETWYLVEEYRRNFIKKGEISKDKDVENVLNSMLNDEIYKESKELAKKVQSYLENDIGNISQSRGIKEETYFVIKKSIMPAVLVEIGFNTNKYEELRLTKIDYLSKISTAIYKGVNSFINEYEKSSGYTK